MGLGAIGAAGAGAQEDDKCWEFWPPEPITELSCRSLDLNKDGWITTGGDVLLYRDRVGEQCPGEGYDPPECGGGGVCFVTEAQGAEFVNGVQTAVILLGIGVPCLVACVTALVFLFLRGK